MMESSNPNHTSDINSDSFDLMNISLLLSQSMIREIFITQIECVMSTTLIHVALQGLQPNFGTVGHSISFVSVHSKDMNAQNVK